MLQVKAVGSRGLTRDNAGLERGDPFQHRLRIGRCSVDLFLECVNLRRKGHKGYWSMCVMLAVTPSPTYTRHAGGMIQVKVHD